MTSQAEDALDTDSFKHAQTWQLCDTQTPVQTAPSGPSVSLNALFEACNQKDPQQGKHMEAPCCFSLGPTIAFQNGNLQTLHVLTPWACALLLSVLAWLFAASMQLVLVRCCKSCAELKRNLMLCSLFFSAAYNGSCLALLFEIAGKPCPAEGYSHAGLLPIGGTPIPTRPAQHLKGKGPLPKHADKARAKKKVRAIHPSGANGFTKSPAAQSNAQFFLFPRSLGFDNPSLLPRWVSCQ